MKLFKSPHFLVFCYALLVLIVSTNVAIASDYGFRIDGDLENNLITKDTKILSAKDIERYKNIFELQEKGQLTKAKTYINGLENEVLMGYVLAQKYLHPKAYRSKYNELKNWLYKYNDHPQATRIYKLAKKRGSKKGLKAPAKLKKIQGSSSSYKWLRGSGYGHLSSKNRRIVTKKLSYFRRYIRKGYTKSAKRVLNDKTTKKLLTRKDYDELSGALGFQYFIDGRYDWAYKWASEAGDRSGGSISLWAAGLSAWKLKKYSDAARHFSSLAEKTGESEWLVSAGAYWAYRSYIYAGEPSKAANYLHVAKIYDKTFYGILARYTLGLDLDYDWNNQIDVRDRDVNQVMRLKASKRAVALLQIGNKEDAEKEFRRVYAECSESQREALMVIAEENDMHGLAFKLAISLNIGNNGNYNKSIYPIPNWAPKDGWKLDRALIYAFIRQESAFETSAKSRAGARGLMQLLPSTAALIANDYKLRRRHRSKLNNPELNIKLGQNYISHLMEYEKIGKNLFFIATAYNGGPGNLFKWKKRLKDNDDPLLFIESLPAKETRIYIERIMTNIWIYRSRLGQDTPSLEQLANGEWPMYESQEDGWF